MSMSYQYGYLNETLIQFQNLSKVSWGNSIHNWRYKFTQLGSDQKRCIHPYKQNIQKKKKKLRELALAKPNTISTSQMPYIMLHLPKRMKVKSQFQKQADCYKQLNSLLSFNFISHMIGLMSCSVTFSRIFSSQSQSKLQVLDLSHLTIYARSLVVVNDKKANDLKKCRTRQAEKAQKQWKPASLRSTDVMYCNYCIQLLE